MRFPLKDIFQIYTFTWIYTYSYYKSRKYA